MPNFLLMIFRLSRWFVTQVLHHYLLMRGFIQNIAIGVPMEDAIQSWWFKTSLNDVYNNLPSLDILYLDGKLNFSEHINEKIKNSSQRNNNGLSEKIESIQYNAALALTGAIKRTSREKLHQELGLESLKHREDSWDDFAVCIRFYSRNYSLNSINLYHQSWLIPWNYNTKEE